MNLSEKLSPVIEQVAAECGVEILELAVERNHSIRIVIDRENGPVTIDVCQRVNRAVRSGLADAEHDVDAFHIEIMSPGINRRLIRPDDFERFRGERVKVSLRQAVDGQRNFTGDLVGYEGDVVTVLPLDTDETRDFRMADVREVRLAPDPKEIMGPKPEKELKGRKGPKGKRR